MRYGGAGGDRLVGGAGGDVFVEGRSPNGSDTILGRSQPLGQYDTAFYSERRRGVRADLDGRRNDGERGERDRLAGIEGLVGGRGADRLTGDRHANQLAGGPGPDTLFGLAGHDSMSGSEGNDILDGGRGSDRLDGSVGDDLVLARDGFPDNVSCDANEPPPGGIDEITLDELDYFANTVVPPSGAPSTGGVERCEQVSRDGQPGLTLLDPHAQVYGGRAQLSVGCPADAHDQACQGEVLLFLRGRLIRQQRVSGSYGAYDTVRVPLPQEVIAEVDAHTTLSLIVEIRFQDPTGSEIRHTMPLTLCDVPC